MKTRRELLTQIVAAAVAGKSVGRALGTETGERSSSRTTLKNSLRTRSAVRRDDTILRLGGHAYISSMTWTADDQQFVSINDGIGWKQNPRDPNFYSSGLFAVEGNPQRASFEKVLGYPDIWEWDCVKGGPYYYALNALAVDGRVYQFLSSYDRIYKNFSRSFDEIPDAGFNCAKLIYSPDKGHTWCNQDGSTPVAQEPRQDQSQKNMVFFHEPKGAFSQLSFLQMGKDYKENWDGYVYVYAPNGMIEGTMNELVMLRVEKKKILDRGAYEYFGGLRADGNPDWVKDIRARGVVHTFPGGLVPKLWPFAWLPSVVYNAPLGVYLMANCSGVPASCIAPDPTYLGFWVATNPWGPWTQIHEETAWTPGGDSAARATAPVIAPKWISKDGRSFWLIWTDVQQTTSEDLISDGFYHGQSRDEWTQAMSRWHQYHPYWGFNAQRVDLILD